MASTGLYAPAHRVQPRTASGKGGPDQAPSFDYGGNGIQDPRLAFDVANSATGAGAIGWLGASRSKVTSQVPATASTTNIAAGQHVVSGTAMTLVSATGSGITVVGTGGTAAWPNYTNAIPAGALAIDGLPGRVNFGSKFISSFYDPTTGLCRAVSVTGVVGGSGGTLTVHGADWYGYPMSQTITLAAGANTVNSTKAFKFITSVVPNYTDANNVSVGTADVFGLNLAADVFADVEIQWAGVVALLATFTAAVTTTASSTTGDVRGTFTPASASDGTKRLDIYVTPSLSRVATAPMATGLFGVAQA